MLALQALVEEAIAQHHPDTSHRLIARERVALVKLVPPSGADTVGHVFPSQLVTLVLERGKWVQIKYYDFLQQDTQTGWALKKYFMRVRDTRDRHSAGRASD